MPYMPRLTYRTATGALADLECRQCGSHFEVPRRRGRPPAYCSGDCRTIGERDARRERNDRRHVPSWSVRQADIGDPMADAGYVLDVPACSLGTEDVPREVVTVNGRQVARSVLDAWIAATDGAWTPGIAVGLTSEGLVVIGQLADNPAKPARRGGPYKGPRPAACNSSGPTPPPPGYRRVVRDGVGMLVSESNPPARLDPFQMPDDMPDLSSVRFDFLTADDRAELDAA